MDNERPQVLYLGEMQKLSLKPDDILVLSVDGMLSDETARRLKAHLAEIIPGHEIVVLGNGMKIGVLERDAAAIRG